MHLTPFLLAAQLLGAQAVGGECRLGVHVENDMFTGTDRHYTQGLRINELNCLNTTWEWSHALMRQLTPGFFDLDDTEYDFGFALAHNIYTPTNIHIPDIIKDDRPYAAWLYVGVVGRYKDTRRLLEVELDLGATGPVALGDEVQSQWHNLLGIPAAQGWGNQTANAPAGRLMVLYRHHLVDLPLDVESAREDAGDGGKPWLFDATAESRLQLGNVFSTLGVGATARFGLIRSRWGIQDTMPGAGLAAPWNPWELYLFTRAGGRLVGLNALVSGAPGAESPHTVPSQWFVLDGDVGIGGSAGPLWLQASVVGRSSEVTRATWKLFEHVFMQIQIGFTPSA